MNRRGFMRTIVGSTAAIAVAPATALAELDALSRSGRTYFDMGRARWFVPRALAILTRGVYTVTFLGVDNSIERHEQVVVRDGGFELLIPTTADTIRVQRVGDAPAPFEKVDERVMLTCYGNASLLSGPDAPAAAGSQGGPAAGRIVAP